MSGNKLLVLLFLVCYGLMSNNDYYKPATLMNVTIYVEKGALNDVLHVFFIRGKLSFTTRSLQYYFFDKLQFTNLRLEVPTKSSHVETFEDLKVFLDSLVTKEDEMKKIREKARLSVQPFIYKFKSKDGNQEREEVDLMKFEIERIKTILANNSSDRGAFVLSGNYFKWENDQMRVPPAPRDDSSYIDIFVDRSKDPITAPIDNDKQITPMALVITNQDNGHTIPEKKIGVFAKFDFLKEDGVWQCPYLISKPDGGSTWNLPALKSDGPELKSKDLLEAHIFSYRGKAATSTPALFTNFIQAEFFYTMLNLVEHKTTEKDKFIHILYQKRNGKTVVTFDDIVDDPTLDEPMRGKYNISAELKKSFNADVFHTSVNPFKKNSIRTYNNFNY